MIFVRQSEEKLLFKLKKLLEYAKYLKYFFLPQNGCRGVYSSKPERVKTTLSLLCRSKLHYCGEHKTFLVTQTCTWPYGGCQKVPNFL